MKTSRNPYSIKDHLGNVRVTFADKKIPANNQLLDFYTETQSVSTYYPFGWEVKPLSWAFESFKFGFNGKEKDGDLGALDYGARIYSPKLGRWLSTDPDFRKRNWLSPYNFVQNAPLNRFDPSGNLDYPIVRITKIKTGKALQRVIGFVKSINTFTLVDLYKVEVTDTEDKNFKMEFSVTRDAWAVTKGSEDATNFAFEPKNGKINHYLGHIMPNGYPVGGLTALYLTQRGKKKIPAQSNQSAVDMGYRKIGADIATGIMFHVGGIYNKLDKTVVAASEGCFGICSPSNSIGNPSNDYTNFVLGKIIAQSKKSKTKPGRIEIIIEKREGNEIKKTKSADEIFTK